MCALAQTSGVLAQYGPPVSLRWMARPLVGRSSWRRSRRSFSSSRSDSTARAWAKASEWEQYRALQAAAKAAHAEAAAAQPDDGSPAPVAAVALPAARPAAVPAPEPEFANADEDQELVLEGLTPDEVRDWRVRAMKDHQVVFDHIDGYGEPSARRLFSNQLVNEAQHLSGLGHLNLCTTATRMVSKSARTLPPAAGPAIPRSVIIRLIALPSPSGSRPSHRTTPSSPGGSRP